MIIKPLNNAEDIIVITDPAQDRYSSLRLMDWWNQEALSKATILVAGCGALGNEVLKNLSLMGVGKLLVVDFDTIDTSNLSRSVLFREGDQGKSKAQIAAARIKELNPDVRIMALDCDVTLGIGLGVFRRMNAVISCLDSREARLGLNRHCWRAGVPLIDGGLHMAMGQLRVFRPPDGACYECTLNESDYQSIGLRYSCTGFRKEKMHLGRVPTGTAIASIIGAMQAQEAIKIIHNMRVEGGQGIGYNSMTRQFFNLKYQRRADCIAHETYRTIVSCNNTSNKARIGQILDIAEQRLGSGTVLYLDRDILVASECLSCKTSIQVQRVFTRSAAEEAVCPTCGSPMIPRLSHIIDRESPLLEKTITELGLPAFHIFKAVNDGKTEFFEISGDEDSVMRFS